MVSLWELNSLDFEPFIEKMGNVVEKCPTIIGALWSYRPFTSIEDMLYKINTIVHQLPYSGKHSLHFTGRGRLICLPLK